MSADISRALGQSILGLNQQQGDYNHASDSHFKKLRAEAEREHEKYQQLAGQSHRAFNNGEKEEASALSEQSKKHKSRADDLNQQAAAWVFRENNTDSAADEIDLHGLFVREALSALDARIQAGIQRRESILKVITGKGMHSAHHIAKLRPAVEDYCNKSGLQWRLQHKNEGVVEINLASPGTAAPNAYQGYQQAPGNQGFGYQHQQQHGGQNNINVKKIVRFIRGFMRVVNLFKQCM